MADVNSVTLIGRLTKDVKREDFGQNAKYTISIAVNKKVKQNGAWVDKGNFFDVVMWNIHKISEYLTKGRQIAVHGELAQDIWERNGQKNSRVYVNADTLELLAPPKDASDQKPSNGAGDHPTPPKQQQDLSALDNMDDIPF